MCAQDVLLKNLYIESLFHKRKEIDKGKRFESWDFQQLSAMAGMHVCMYVCIYVMNSYHVVFMYVYMYVQFKAIAIEWPSPRRRSSLHTFPRTYPKLAGETYRIILTAEASTAGTDSCSSCWAEIWPESRMFGLKERYGMLVYTTYACMHCMYVWFRSFLFFLFISVHYSRVYCMYVSDQAILNSFRLLISVILSKKGTVCMQSFCVCM